MESVGILIKSDENIEGKMFLIKNISNNVVTTCSPYFNKQDPPINDIQFIDLFFKSELSSIFRNNEARKFTTQNIKTIKNLIWVRPNQVFKNNFKLYNVIESTDVKFGLLENSYFLSSLGSLAVFNDIFKKILITHEYNPQGLYKVRLFINGKPKIVFLDDFFPAYPTKTWVFSYSGPNEFWVQLMEKAWAKVCGSYASTIGGVPSDALSSLIESPCFTFNHNRLGKEKIWQEIIEAFENNYVICTNSDDDDDLEDLGIMKFQTYTIIMAKEFKGMKFVRLRNHWGGYEWKGDYSDESDKWTEDLKEILGYKNENDGVFFMLFEDFFRYFDYTFISKYHKGFQYNFNKFYQESVNHFVTAKIFVKKLQKVYIGLHQKQERFYKDVRNYKPLQARLFVVKYNPKVIDNNQSQYEFIGSEFSQYDKLYILEDLSEGEYHIFGNIKWTYEQRCSVIISTYCEDSIAIENLEKDLVPSDFLSQILLSFLEKIPKKEISEGLYAQRSLENNKTGYGMIKFINEDINNNKKIMINYNTSDFKLISIKDEKQQFYVRRSDYKLVVFEALSDQVKPFDIDIEEESYSCIEINKDLKKTFFSRILENLNMKKLNKDCYLVEYYNNQSVFIIIFNENLNTNYRAKINYNKLVNLRVDVNEKIILNKDFEYFEMIKTPSQNQYYYEYTVSLKSFK